MNGTNEFSLIMLRAPRFPFSISKEDFFNTSLLEVFTNCMTVPPCLSTDIQEVSTLLGCQSHVI